ncbi:acyl carrier protein [Enterobacteriaceae bacterium H11S18]|uniref:acyl carrier protein n=1 Tax=Dryocola clanedunensis TaxID=2925396 RepID=UPI0022F03D1C|nr:acyl carrier protein [Dryocola clanedunensis]MCT4708896.1 acyl carrier protein [Dryocola clanedunensis]
MNAVDLEYINKEQVKALALQQYIAWLQNILEKPVSVEDNFLDIGGHSMIAIALNERVRNEFNITLSMERLYNSTLSETFYNIK